MTQRSALQTDSDPDLESELLRCQRALEAERARATSLERLLDEKCQSLFLAQQNVEETHGFLQSVLSALPNAVVVTDHDGRIVDTNAQTCDLSGHAKPDLIGLELQELMRLPDADDGRLPVDARAVEGALVTRDGEELPVLFRTARLTREDRVVGFVCIATDLRHRQMLEDKLREANRLESVGQLAAGVAHELNTPIQFVSDSAQFLSDAFEDIERVRSTIEREILDQLDASKFARQMAHIEATRSEVDMDFLLEEIPEAVRRCQVGTERVSAIVRAMKRFSHPGSDRMTPDDVNEVLDSSAIMAKSEYKYCAELELDLGTVPLIPLDVGQLNQAIVNLIVNAAHAIQDAQDGAHESRLGRIRIHSRVDGEAVLISIADDGIGMPSRVRDRIFEPFFTTKCVGRGTGQGLAQVWSAVVERHKGTIDVVSKPGDGTRFEIRLPLVDGEPS